MESNQPPSIKMSHSIHLGLTMLHFVIVLASVAMTVLVSTYTFSTSCDAGSCQALTSITSTFLSTRRVESNIGWAVATERSKFDTTSAKRVQYPLLDTTAYNGYAFAHYFECMHVAQMADQTCKFPDSLDSYVSCLLNTNATKNALLLCDKFPTIAGPGYTHFPTSEEYLTCLSSQYPLRNSISRRASNNVFRSCVAKTMWPFFEVPLDIDTPVPFGSFNWGLFLLLGMVVMTSFAVYSASWVEDGPVKNGEPQYFMRLGLFWTWIAWIWNFAFFIVFLIIAVRDSGSFESNGGLPTTITTSLVTLAVLAFALVYFGNELFTASQWSFIANLLQGKVAGSERATRKVVKVYHDYQAGHRKVAPDRVPLVPRGARSTNLSPLNSGFAEMGASMPRPGEEYEISDELVARYYTPPLLSTWADGYLADAFLFLGMAGATQQLTTDQAWSIFVLITMYRVLNMMIGRFMYECFMNNLSLPDDVNAAKFNLRPAMFGHNQVAENDVPTDPHLSTRVMALSTPIAAIYLYIAVLFIMFNGNVVLSDFKMFKDFVICCFVVPEVIRILLHLYCQMYNTSYKTSSWMLLNVSFFVWIWDLTTRLVFVSMVFLQSDNSVMGTRQYLLAQSNSLLRDYGTIMIP